MATAFVSPNFDGKPHVPRWEPPPPTREDLDWASLHTIDLSLLDSSDEKVVSDLVQLTKTAIKEDGFLYLTVRLVAMRTISMQIFS
jgi:hypothetical protein